MSLSYFRPEQGTLARIRARETAAAYRQTAAPAVTETFVAALDALYQAYPHMDAGVLMGLAKQGLSPGDPLVQQIADLNFEQKRRSGAFDRIGDVLGGAAKAVGVPLSAVGRGFDAALGGVDEAIAPTTKATVRTGFVALESGLQELQTIIRAGGWAGARVNDQTGADTFSKKLANLANPSRWDDWAETFGEAFADAGSSSGREAISAMLRGEDVDLGSGFLPAGQIEETVRERSNRLTLQVGGVQFGGPGNPSISAGRAIAATVSEPGQAQYNVLSGLIDGGVAWFGDPAAAIGGVAKATRAGSRLGRAARSGNIDELRHIGQFTPVIDRSFQSRAAEGLGDLVDNVTGRITSARGQRNSVQPDLVEQWLTKGGRRVVSKIAETSDFNALREATGKKIPVALTVKLADATNEQEVLDILRPALGTQLREAPEFLGFKVRRSQSNGLRLAQEMPGAFIDPGDLDGAVEGLDRWLRNAKVSPELRSRSLEALARNTSRQTMVSTMDSIMGDVADDLAERLRPRKGGTPKMRARRFTQMFNRDVEKARTYFIDEIAENRKAVGVNVGGTVIEAQSPYLFTEYLNSVIPLPDAREIRRATSTLNRLVDNPFFERTTGALDGLLGVWKKATLLRGAYTVRVIGEEQVRMAASGLDSMFAHPISAISALVGDPERSRHFIGHAKLGTGRRRQADVLGDDFFEGAEAASDDLRGALARGWDGWVDDTKFDQEFTVFKPTDEGYQRAWAQAIGEVHHDPIARKVAEAQGNLADVKDWFFRRQGRKFRKQMVESRPELATQAGSDAYIDTLWEGIQYRTAGDPVLMEAVATGKIGDARIGRVGDSGRYAYSDELMAHLDDVVGPEAVKGQKILMQGGSPGLGEVWDNATGWAFSHLMTKPTNYLSRSTTFRQKYWERIEEMLPYMDDATRAKALSNATGVVDGAQLKRMRQAAPATNRSITELDDADMIAKAYGLDETKKLLYDLSDRGQFFDVFRLIFPFGEAWREVLTRWAKIGAQNPRAVRRAQQLITGARGNGFFHKDVNGEEVFTYPFSRQISKALIGMPIDLNGRVAGLSLMTEILPGVGPVVQLPAAALIPETPDWDWAREFVAPYGNPDFKGGLLESLLPGYAKNIRQFFEQGDDRLFANSVGASMDYLASTGDYDMSNPASIRQMTADATNLAKKVYMLRGLTQFGAPTSPMPEYLVEDEDGDLETARVVLQDFYAMQEEDYDSAVGRFLEKYGEDTLLMMQGKSFAIPPKLPVTHAAAEWERSNGDIVKDYGNVWGFFAPAGDTEDFDYQAYVRQFARGDRVTLTPEQRVSLAQAKVGRHIYDLAQQKVSERPTRVEREWLAAVKDRIRAEYPGYAEMTAGFGGGISGLPARPSTEAIVGELQRAIADPRLADSEVATAASLYLQARSRALAYAAEVGVKSLDAQAATPARVWLAGVARRISARYPSFEEMFDTVFAREVET